MGKRKREMADRLKEIKSQTAIAKLNDVPTSPQKMRLVADTIRGQEVNHALDILKYSKKEASVRLEKLLRSAIANWEAKNEDNRKAGICPERARKCGKRHCGCEHRSCIPACCLPQQVSSLAQRRNRNGSDFYHKESGDSDSADSDLRVAEQGVRLSCSR